MLEASEGNSKSCALWKRFFTISILIVSLMFIISPLGCQEMFKGMGEMMALQQKLAEEFNTQNIGIKITNNTHLALTFQNSPMANLPKSEQAPKAREIASFVRDHYDGYGSLSTISVLFIQHNRYGPLNVTKTQAAFSFKTSELGPKLPQA